MEVANGEAHAGGDQQDAAGSPAASRITSADIDKLFKGPINRRVLRHVADVGTLRPQSVPEARALLARFRERMWALKNDNFPQREPFPYENFKKILDDVGPGRILLKAMVDEAAARLPASQKDWPLAVIRQLVPQQVQNRLALGGTSSIGFLSGILGSRGTRLGLPCSGGSRQRSCVSAPRGSRTPCSSTTTTRVSSRFLGSVPRLLATAPLTRTRRGRRTHFSTGW